MIEDMEQFLKERNQNLDDYWKKYPPDPEFIRLCNKSYEEITIEEMKWILENVADESWWKEVALELIRRIEKGR